MDEQTIEFLLTFGRRLKRIRKSRGFSMRELAEKSGVAFSYISELESGAKLNPTVDALCRLATALGVPLTMSFEAVPGTDAAETRRIAAAFLQETDLALLESEPFRVRFSRLVEFLALRDPKRMRPPVIALLFGTSEQGLQALLQGGPPDETVFRTLAVLSGLPQSFWRHEPGCD